MSNIDVFQISDVFIFEYGVDNEYQSYFLKLDLMDDTIENVKYWEEWFDTLGHGQRLKVTLELDTQ